MPLIYRIKCSACGKGPTIKSFVAGWVTTDDEKGGTILPDSYMALKLDTGEFVCLPHPGEGRSLKSYGFEWDEAARQGRLFHITFKICTKCGLINEDPETCTPQIGCGGVMLAVAVAIVSLRGFVKLNWLLTIIIGFFICFAGGWFVDHLNKLRRRKSDQSLRLKSCSGCNGVDFLEIPNVGDKSMPCPSCKADALKYTAAGIS